MNTLAMSTRPFTDADRGIADWFSTYVANFIRSGDPNGAGLPAWPAVSTDPALTMQVGDTFAPIPVASSAARLAFFEKHFARQAPATR